MFEAWGQLTGAPAVDRLRELLEPKGIFKRRHPADVRACALFALGKVRTLEARMLVDQYTADPEVVVRSAANAVLREWAP
jgi:HEAT repeat protein